MNKQLQAIKDMGTEILTKEQTLAAAKKTYPLTCDIHLGGLVKKMMSEFSYSTALIRLRKCYGIVRISRTAVICVDTASPFYTDKTRIKGRSSC